MDNGELDSDRNRLPDVLCGDSCADCFAARNPRATCDVGNAAPARRERTIKRRLEPASHSTFVTEIFLSEFSLEVSFFARNHETIGQNEPDRHGEKHPDRIHQERDPERPQSKSKVHRVPTKTIEAVRNNSRCRMKRDRIVARSLLRYKSGDIQKKTGKNNQRTGDPAQAAVNETCRH